VVINFNAHINRIDRINNAIKERRENAGTAPTLTTSQFSQSQSTIFDMSPMARQNMEQRTAKFEMLDRLRQDMENAREAAEAEAEYWEKMRIAMEIARRIMRGDNVPPQDESFLMEHNPGLYKLATSLRDFTNDDPEDHDSLLGDQREGNQLADQINALMGTSAPSGDSSSSSSGSPAPAASAPSAPSGY